jgi:hypothetical protein
MQDISAEPDEKEAKLRKRIAKLKSEAEAL